MSRSHGRDLDNGLFAVSSSGCKLSVVRPAIHAKRAEVHQIFTTRCYSQKITFFWGPQWLRSTWIGLRSLRRAKSE
jgi:hypothetical protein